MTIDRHAAVMVLPLRMRGNFKLLFLAAFLAAGMTAALTAITGAESPASPGASPRPSAPATVINLPADGAVFHLRERVFARHGAAAAEITSRAGVGALPETYIRESWARVDADSRLLELVAEVRANDGRLLQRSRTAATEMSVDDLVSGKSQRTPRTSAPHGVMAPEDLAKQGWDHYRAAFDAGGMGLVRTGQIGGETLAIFSERLPPMRPIVGTVKLSDGSMKTVTAATVPYVGDIDLTAMERRVAFDDATRTPRYEETAGTLSDGSRIVIESIHWLTWETLPASTWSALVTEGS